MLKYLLNKTIYILLVISLLVVSGIAYKPQSALASIGIDIPSMPTDVNVFLYRNPENLRYYAVDCDSMKIIENSFYLKPAWEAAFDHLPTNGKLIGGGAGGWYSDDTLVIRGKAHPEYGDYPAGFQETIIDLEKIELVMTGDKDRDFI